MKGHQHMRKNTLRGEYTTSQKRMVQTKNMREYIRIQGRTGGYKNTRKDTGPGLQEYEKEYQHM